MTEIHTAPNNMISLLPKKASTKTHVLMAQQLMLKAKQYVNLLNSWNVEEDNHMLSKSLIK